MSPRCRSRSGRLAHRIMRLSLAELTHLHLLLNHVPIIGSILSLGILLLSAARRNDALRRVGYEAFFILALIALPTYVTGLAAQKGIASQPDVSSILIDEHHDAALFALLLMEITGIVAWFGLWQFHRNLPSRRW